MDATPLTLAHSHARNASNETQKANPAAASEEHDLAAAEFANAAKVTSDGEAFRTLKLLEQHHQKLAQLLQFRTSHPVAAPSEAAPEPTAAKSSPQASPSTEKIPRPRNLSPSPSPQPSPLSPHFPPRDLSSSIASNLASARGIPSNKQRRGSPLSPTISAQQAGGKGTNPPARSKLRESEQQDASPGRPKGLPRSASTPAPSALQDKVGESPPLQPERSDEPFQRFYATFEGLLSKLSAPLAFAGLPLGLEEATLTLEPPPTQKPKPKPEERAIADPDVAKIFSKAALRAIREENGTNGGAFGGAESFYVVPTTGGTISYAGILSRAEQEARAAAGAEADDQYEDEFVDARETPQPASPELRKKGRPKPGTKTMEELQLENEALRALADHLSVRLQRFEMGAQTSSMALQRSIRALHQSPSASDAGVGSGEKNDEKAKALGEEMAALKKELEKLGRENEKLRGVVARYRERWEKLKEGARVRRGGKDDGGVEG
ncbi:hypothetical protein LPUS_02809 [Lasallia pustulata]|uniref:Uncharacterized protein n=1 Tax=Lasallia pustulata TaxID=136370 RepID=A0A1W5CTK7_9LECA|nr:hypothetical protein LPUS_02809 [Lasallia pustulata]